MVELWTQKFSRKEDKVNSVFISGCWGLSESQQTLQRLIKGYLEIVSKSYDVTYTFTIGLSFFLIVCKCPRLRTLASVLTLFTFSEMTRCFATAWSRMRAPYLLFFVSFCLVWQQRLLCPA